MTASWVSWRAAGLVITVNPAMRDVGSDLVPKPVAVYTMFDRDQCDVEGERVMPVFSVWESHFPLEASDEARQITEAIWRDMKDFDGYISHELIEDLDDAGHLLVVSQWTTRELADAVLREYASHANARRVSELVSRPRTRFVGHGVPSAA